MPAASASDSHLTALWEDCALARAITHEEHLRIAFVLLRRHGRVEGTGRFKDGTRPNCEALNAADRYDEELTLRWTKALADALEARDAGSADEFIRNNPLFLNSELFGMPRWRTEHTEPEAEP